MYPLKHGMQNVLDYSASNRQPTIGDLSANHTRIIIIINNTMKRESIIFSK
jgi:hypothetical protein